MFRIVHIIDLFIAILCVSWLLCENQVIVSLSPFLSRSLLKILCSLDLRICSQRAFILSQVELGVVSSGFFLCHSRQISAYWL